MARTTPEEVKDITTLEVDVSRIAPFITLANLMVTEDLATVGYTDERLGLIETWLSAHLVKSTISRDKESQSLGDGSTVTFQGETGLDLDSTPYGQQVKMLDPSGILAKRGAGLKRASLRAVREVPVPTGVTN